MAAKRGFTLIEAIIALTIFTIIMAALATSMQVALNGFNKNMQRQDETGSVRVVFDSLTRDIQSAFASPNSPASVFIAGGGGAGNGNNLSGAGLLTLTTLSQRIQADSLMSGQSTDPNAVPNQNANQTPFTPQSDVALVQYTLEPSSNGANGTMRLKRYVSQVPNSQQLGQPEPTGMDPNAPTKSDLADNIVDLTLQFYDRQQQTMRPDWDFEQQNLQSQNQQANGANGANGSTPAATQTGDSVLPGSVRVDIQIRKKDGKIAKFFTTIPIVAAQPQPATSAIPTSGGSSSTTAPGG